MGLSNCPKSLSIRTLRCFAPISRAEPENTHLSVVRKAAAENGFYTIPADGLMPEVREGHNPEIIESALADIEASAAVDIKSIRNGQSKLGLEVHYRLARLAALQLGRIPRFRQDYIDLANVEAREFLARRLTLARVRNYLKTEGLPTDNASVRWFQKEALNAEYSLIPSQTDLTQQTLQFAIEKFMPELIRRTPKILRLREPSLLTSDAGVGLWAPDHERPRSAGIAEARAVFLPLDRITAVAFMPNGSPSDRTVDRIWADHINLAVADAAKTWIYHHPDDTPLTRIDLPPVRRLVREVDSIELLEDGKVRVRGKRFWA